MLTPFQDRAKLALAVNPFFGALPEECLGWLRRTPVRSGETLFEKGDPSDRLFGLIRGQAKLCSAGSCTPAKRMVAFRIVAPGEMVGELGFSNRGPRHATTVALAHCEFATLDRQDFEPLLERQPELREVLAAQCSVSAQRLAERIENEAYLTIEERVQSALVDCANRFGVRVDGGAVRIDLKQQDLADVLGLSRATINRVLTSRAMCGRVELGRGRITLLGV